MAASFCCIQRWSLNKLNPLRNRISGSLASNTPPGARSPFRPLLVAKLERTQFLRLKEPSQRLIALALGRRQSNGEAAYKRLTNHRVFRRLYMQLKHVTTINK